MSDAKFSIMVLMAGAALAGTAQASLPPLVQSQVQALPAAAPEPVMELARRHEEKTKTSVRSARLAPSVDGQAELTLRREHSRKN